MLLHEPIAFNVKGRKVKLDDSQLRTVRFLFLITLAWIIVATVALMYVPSLTQKGCWICLCIIPVLMQLYYTSIEVDFTVLNRLNSYLGFISILSFFVITDINLLVMIYVFYILTLGTRFHYGKCMYRVITKTEAKKTGSGGFNRKNLIIFCGAVVISFIIFYRAFHHQPTGGTPRN